MKDYGYQTFFPKDDLPHLKAMVREVNRTHDVSIIGEYNEMCEMQVKGYKGVGMTAPDGHRLVPDATIKTDDVVTLPGLNLALDIIRATSALNYRYMMLGNAGSDVTPSTADTGLVFESVARIDMINPEIGWREPEGMHMLFGAVMGETTSITVSEMGVNTSSSGGTMFNHEIFYPRRLNKTNLKFSLFFSCVIEMVPKATGF